MSVPNMETKAIPVEQTTKKKAMGSRAAAWVRSRSSSLSSPGNSPPSSGYSSQSPLATPSKDQSKNPKSTDEPHPQAQAQHIGRRGSLTANSCVPFARMESTDLQAFME